MEFARWFFYIHESEEGSKVTRYDSLTQVAKQTGREPEELQLAPSFPAACRHLWDVFMRLDTVSYQEINAYALATYDQLEPWEINSIIALDKVRSNPPVRFQWQKKQR